MAQSCRRLSYRNLRNVRPRACLQRFVWITWGYTSTSSEGSSLRQPRLAHSIKTVLGILGVLVDGKGLISFNRETGVDSQHLRGFGPGLLKLPRLRVGGRQRDMRTLQIG